MNIINKNKELNDIKLNMRVIHNAKNPDTSTEIFGKSMRIPIFAAPITATGLNMGGIVKEEDSNLVPLSNGCICCTLKVDLMKQIGELVRTGKFDYILIEASGICEPLPIAQTITVLEEQTKAHNMPITCRLDNVVTVVDAARLVYEFGAGENLVKEDIEDEDIENLLIQQIEFCSTIVINKVDDVSDEELKKVRAVVKTLQPVAKIIETNYAKVEVKEIIDTNNFDYEKTITSAGWYKELANEDNEHEEEHHEHHDHHEHDGEHCEECEKEGHDHNHEHHHHHHHHNHNHEEGEAEEYGIGTFVYTRRKPFNRNKFEEYVNFKWRKNIIRAKGIVWFSDDNEMSYVFEQAGNQMQLAEGGYWLATAPKDELDMMAKENPEILKGWDNEVGDRIIKLVFIGQKLEKEEIKSELDKILD